MNEITPYTVKEVAALMGFSERKIIELFEHERGVLVIHGTKGERRYRSMRIPRHVYERVLGRISVR